jgi:hypothetical protein
MRLDEGDVVGSRGKKMAIGEKTWRSKKKGVGVGASSFGRARPIPGPKQKKGFEFSLNDRSTDREPGQAAVPLSGRRRRRQFRSRLGMASRAK